MTLETFFEKFDLFAEAPDAVDKMREIVLQLAVDGRLVERSEEWTAKPLKLLATKIGSGATPDGGRESYVSSGIPLIRSMNVYFGGFRQAGLAFLTDSQAKELSNVVVRADDVLLNITGASIGRVTLAPAEMAGARVNQHVAIIRPKEELLPRFLAFFLASPKVQRMIDGVQVGATRQALTKGMIEQFEIPLPTTEEQARIVEKVDEVMSLCDRLEAQQQERETRHAALSQASLSRFAEDPTPANLNLLFHPSYTISPADLRKSILNLAVRGKLTSQDSLDEGAQCLNFRFRRAREQIAKEQGVRVPKNVPPYEGEASPFRIPDSWNWERLGNLAITIEYGTSERAGDDRSQVPIYRMGNIAGGRLLDGNLKYVSAGIDDLPGLYLKSGDILFNRTNSFELVGKAGIFIGPDDSATFASYLIRIRLTEEFFLPSYFNLAMSAPYFRETQIIPEITQQCGQANFNGTKLASTLVPVPPLAEQRRIVAKVEQLMTLVDQLDSRISGSRINAERLMEAIVAEIAVKK